MPDQTSRTTLAERRSGSSGLAFIVGILVVVVGVLAYILFGSGDLARNGDDIDVTIEAPAAPAVEGAVEGAGGETAPAAAD
jgi:hypothetical protein